MALLGTQIGLTWDDAEHVRIVPIAEADEVVVVESIVGSVAFCRRDNGMHYIVPVAAIALPGEDVV